MNLLRTSSSVFWRSLPAQPGQRSKSVARQSLESPHALPHTRGSTRHLDGDKQGTPAELHRILWGDMVSLVILRIRILFGNSEWVEAQQVHVRGFEIVDDMPFDV